MSAKKHRLGVNDAFLVTRKFKLSYADTNAFNEAVQKIDQLYGMDSLKFIEKSKMLKVSYDASRMSVDDIISIFEKWSVAQKTNWWNKNRIGYYRFVDQNVKNNANSKPTCCNKPPPGTKYR